jgi:hypothetical protein
VTTTAGTISVHAITAFNNISLILSSDQLHVQLTISSIESDPSLPL